MLESAVYKQDSSYVLLVNFPCHYMGDIED